jgi:hypothetical protein
LVTGFTINSYTYNDTGTRVNLNMVTPSTIRYIAIPFL